MHLLPILSILLLLTSYHAAQQQGIEGRVEYYFVMEIGAAADGGKFEFEGVQLTRSGKECTLSRFDGKAPFKLSLVHETVLILRGKAGQAKVVMKYKIQGTQSQSYQYFEKGEAIAVQFVPRPVAGVETRWWTQGDRLAPELSVMAITKQ